MKKAITIILVLMLMASCSMTIKDPEGWEIYQVGWTLDAGKVLVQSKDGYKVGEYLYYESVCTMPVTIENCVDREISVKISKPQVPSEWKAIPPLSSITIAEGEEQ